jgi:hypothetical protein
MPGSVAVQGSTAIANANANSLGFQMKGRDDMDERQHKEEGLFDNDLYALTAFTVLVPAAFMLFTVFCFFAN